MTTPGSLETEQKYDVDTATPLPALLEIPGVDRVAEPVEAQLEAVYFDTETLALAARGITLRRRTGGTDHGWHLKIPVGPDQRQELQAPLGQPATVPEELLHHVLAYTRGEAIRPIARLTTQRTTHRLYGSGGEHLADFVDDHVHAEALEPPRPGMDWREWEIELVHGTGTLFAVAAETLTGAGASRSQHGSKLARALGDSFPSGQAAPAGKAQKDGPAADVVTSYVGGQINELLSLYPGVRLEEPDAVHQMRSATRRIRSALATYRGLFNKAAVTRIEDELRWLARLLGVPRDAEVMRERLRQHIHELPAEDMPGSVLESIEHELGTVYDSGYKAALQALATDRYYRLLDDLEDFRDHPPATSLASRSARKVTAKLVDNAVKRLRRAQKAAANSGKGDARDAALHQVRKDAKRLRHAAESVTGIHGKRAVKLAAAAQQLQKILGDHQDSVVARALLLRLGADPSLPSAAALAFNALRTVEERIAADAEANYRKARKKARGIRL
ncbi:CYTH and CHAD domain-containing protein [Arthrobacter cavernae]|uniref:CYTH and CHAD domain-containing protein n=1 Tax=Arthrobacter cavernae TaxID=2817681 RepID=A0A939HJK7_9MICC|nr:CYTH and CHAD domain-containing protein [Arthrobacter cavernae]MBO1269212.1 CYTH and CHAD domain-containing protein [Arthrobacter cavernae]